ncbi:hypothetical protein D7M15_03120 [Streptomyces sp. Z26]|nr:hypothetical protein D7M15_03120 [Streptomyces sp. Z26]
MIAELLVRTFTVNLLEAAVEEFTRLLGTEWCGRRPSPARNQGGGIVPLARVSILARPVLV